MKERIKSPVVWATVLAQICLIVALVNPNISDTVKIVGTCIIEIFTAFGVLNNPTNREGF